MQNLDLEEDFDSQIDIADYIEPIPAPSPLPQTPVPSADILQQAQAQKRIRVLYRQNVGSTQQLT